MQTPFGAVISGCNDLSGVAMKQCCLKAAAPSGKYTDDCLPGLRLQGRQAVAAALQCWVVAEAWTPDLVTAIFTGGKPLPADGPLVVALVSHFSLSSALNEMHVTYQCIANYLAI